MNIALVLKSISSLYMLQLRSLLGILSRLLSHPGTVELSPLDHLRRMLSNAWQLAATMDVPPIDDSHCVAQLSVVMNDRSYCHLAVLSTSSHGMLLSMFVCGDSLCRRRFFAACKRWAPGLWAAV